jgi:thiol-disulfide isomerase/thioredoxin
MKNSVVLICLLVTVICLQLQAKDKVYEKPYFIARSAQILEVEKVTLKKDTTVLDMRVFSTPTDKVKLLSSAALQSGGKKYSLIKMEGLSAKDWTATNDKGELSFKLFFQALPSKASSFSFIEGDGVGEWRIYGIQLTGKRPSVEIPESLKGYEPGKVVALPPSQVQPGKALLSGRLLGYKDMSLLMSVSYKSWLPVATQSQDININPDGSFRTEIPLMSPTSVKLSIGSLNYTLCLVPGKETILTLNLPAIYIPQSRWFKDEPALEKKIWVEGEMAALNSEIIGKNYPLNISKNMPAMLKDVCGMTPIQFKQHVLKLLSDKRNTLEADQGISDIYRSFLFWNLEMDAWSIISNYKTLLTYAPMFAGVKDAPKPKAEDLKVDSTYYDDLLKLSIVRNPSAMYCFDYPSFLLSQEILGKNKISADELSSQVVGANRLFSQLDKEYKILTVDQENEVNRYSLKEFANILNDKNKGLIDLLATNAKKTGYKVCEMDTAVSGDKLLQALVSPYKGKVVLVDVWATWCGPCKRAMKEMLPMKEELKDQGITYVYLAGDNSPEVIWKNMIPDIHGEHYRVTKTQWADFVKALQVEGVPTYFVINKSGEIAYRTTGFPGVDTMKDELQKALKAN